LTYLLDTNICIYLIKSQSRSLIARVQREPLEEIGISSLTVAELEYGAAKSRRPTDTRIALVEFLSPFRIVDFSESAAYEYGRVRAELERTGQIIGPMDLLIAAHALAENAILITNNEREFRRVSGLRLENWT
jgi:tRNA(fMet)-specific endonuclease VapC